MRRRTDQVPWVLNLSGPCVFCSFQHLGLPPATSLFHHRSSPGYSAPPINASSLSCHHPDAGYQSGCFTREKFYLDQLHREFLLLDADALAPDARQQNG